MSEIKSLARGLTVLKIMAEVDQSIGITNLADKLGVNKSTVSRMVQTLMNHGFVEKSTDGRSYQLGPALVQLSRVVINRLKLRETANPFLTQLVDRTGECAHLAIYAQGKALYIDQVQSDASLRVNADIGHMAPLHCTALGKVLLAFGGYAIPARLGSRTGATITDQEVLANELEKIRILGFAVDNEEYDEGIRCIAAPVFDFSNQCIGSIGISGPTARINLKNISKLSQEVLSISKDLSDRLRFEK